MKAQTVAEVMAGEARSEEDLEMIASTIVNRAQLAGVSLESIVQAPKQFDAYGKSLPPGTTRRDVARAQAILDRVVKEGVPPQYANALGYARDYAVDNLPKSWTPTGIVTPDKHVVYTTPPNAYIATAEGYKPPQAALPTGTYAPPQNTANPFEAQPNAGPAGWAYRDLVQPNPVQTTTIAADGLLDKPRGMEALAPNGLLGDTSIANYDRSQLRPETAGVLDRLAADPTFAGVTVTSGYRDPARNAKVGGAKASQHMNRKAFDTLTRTLPDQEKARMLDRAINAGATGVGLYPSGNMHFDTRETPAIWGPAGYSGSPVSSFPEYARPMLADLMETAQGLPYNPHFDAPVPTPRPDIEPQVAAVERAPLGPVAGAQVPTPRMGDLVSLPGMEGQFQPANAQRGVELASLPQAMSSGAVLNPPQTMQDFTAPSPERMAEIAALAPVSQPAQSLPPDRPMPGGLLAPPAPPTANITPGLLGTPPSSLAQQETALAAMKPGFTPQTQTVQPPQQAAPPLSAPQTVQDAPTVAPPQQATQQTFPAAPPAPEEKGLLDGIFSPQTKAGMAVGSFLGPLGTLGGGLLGRALAGGLLSNGPMGPVAAGDRFGVGTGMAGMEAGMYGARGATGYSRSNPGMSVTSRGPGQGWDLSPNQYGAPTHYTADGHIAATSDTMDRWGGLLGGLFGGGLLGSRPDKDRDKDKGKYSGAGLY